jgi:hypothetical protein
VKVALSTGRWPCGSAASAAAIASSHISPMKTVLNNPGEHSIVAAVSGVADGDGDADGGGTKTTDEGEAEGAGVAGDGVGVTAHAATNVAATSSTSTRTFISNL